MAEAVERNKIRTEVLGTLEILIEKIRNRTQVALRKKTLGNVDFAQQTAAQCFTVLGGAQIIRKIRATTNAVSTLCKIQMMNQICTIFLVILKILVD